MACWHPDPCRRPAFDVLMLQLSHFEKQIAANADRIGENFKATQNELLSLEVSFLCNLVNFAIVFKSFWISIAHAYILRPLVIHANFPVHLYSGFARNYRRSRW